MFFVAGLVQARIWESSIWRNGFSQNWKRKMNMKCCRGDELLGNHFQLSCQSFRVLLSYSRMFRDLSVWHIMFWPDIRKGRWVVNWQHMSREIPSTNDQDSSFRFQDPNISLSFSTDRGNNLYEQLSKRFIRMDHVWRCLFKTPIEVLGCSLFEISVGKLIAAFFSDAVFSGVAIFQLYSVHTPGRYYSCMISGLHHWYTMHMVFYWFVYFLQLVSKTTVPLWLHQLEFASRLIKKLHMSN